MGSKKSKPKRSYFNIIVTILLWIVLLMSGWYAISKVQTEDIYNPFDVLGVKESASEKHIKDAFKKLSRVLHPDKAPEDKREEAGQKYLEISKAYKTLTDEVSRKNWEEYGNPDGPKSMSLGVALPEWMVASGNSSILMVLYCIAFGIALPFFVKIWWKRSSHLNKAGIRHESMTTFFRQLKEGCSTLKIVEMICQSVEVSDYYATERKCTKQSSIDRLISLLEKSNVYGKSKGSSGFDRPKKGTLSASALWAHSLLAAHFYRIPLPDYDLLEDQEWVVTCSYLLLTKGIIPLAIARDWLHSTVACIGLSQFLVQAAWEDTLPVMQLPHITREICKHFVSGKRTIVTVSALLDLAEQERRALLRDLTNEECEDLVQIGESLPHLRIKNITYEVAGRSEITVRSIVTCKITLALEHLTASTPQNKIDAVSEENLPPSPSDGDVSSPVKNFGFDEDGNLLDEDEANIDISKELSLPNPVYCPHFPSTKSPVWWLIILNKSRTNLIVPPVRIHDLVDTKTITVQLPSPQKAMLVNLCVMVRSDCLLGTDVIKELKYNVIEFKEDASSSQKWDISGDEDDDTIPLFQR